MRQGSKMNSLEGQDVFQGSYAFVWHVATCGYELVYDNTHSIFDLQALMEGSKSPRHIDTIDSTPPWLIRKNSLSQPAESRLYAPLVTRTLHREFADLTDDEHLLSFANDYGFLGVGVDVNPVNGGSIEDAESLARWHRELVHMGGVIQIWDWCKEKEEDKQERVMLGQVFRWRDSDRIALEMETEVFARKGRPRVLPLKRRLGGETLASRGNNGLSVEPHLLHRWKPGEVIGPARYYVCREVNKRLRGHVSLQLHPFAEKGHRVGLWPSTLLATMWLMFMWEMTGETRMLLCPSCGKWSKATDCRSRFCSPACRQRAYYKRKKKGEGSHEQEFK